MALEHGGNAFAALAHPLTAMTASSQSSGESRRSVGYSSSHGQSQSDSR